MRLIKYLILFLFPILVQAKIKIAVIDTGYKLPAYPYQDYTGVNLCEGQHADIVKGLTYLNIPPYESHPHGTNVAHIIDNQLGKEYKDDYCLVIIKYYSLFENTIDLSIKAIKYAIDIKVDFINYSGGGTVESAEETRLIKKALNNKIIIVAAAGNNGENLSKSAFYPAMSDNRVIVVGNLKNKKRSPSSNYGKQVDIWENGTEVNGGGIVMSGTSQAAAIVTGKLVKKIIDKKRYDMFKYNLKERNLNE